jgi:hypothetical protein
VAEDVRERQGRLSVVGDVCERLGTSFSGVGRPAVAWDVQQWRGTSVSGVGPQ